MNPLFIYFIKVNIAIALFYLFYRLFFANDTFWKTRRIYLLFSIAASFLYPFLSIQNWIQNQQPVKELLTNYVALQEFTVTPKNESLFFTFENVFLTIYALVTAFLLVKMLIQLVSILKIKLTGTTQFVQEVKVVVIKKQITPFSFFGTIYMHPALHTDDELKQILTHELTHVRQLHSFDVVLSELLCIAFWINPATWLFRHEIRQNLEFLADNQVIESGIDLTSYQYHLLQLSYQSPDLKLTNKFNILPLKKRIIMMNQQKSRKSTALKYLLIAPLTFTLVLLSNAETIASSAAKIINGEQVTSPLKENKVAINTNSPTKMDEVAVVGNVKQDDTKKKEVVPPLPPAPKDELLPPPPPPTSNNETVFQVVEKMPQFPSGEAGLFNFLGMNIRYPIEAMKSGIQGRVICSFIVRNDGSIDSIKVLRSADTYLDKEAVRVIKAMPNWIPGEQKGQRVNVKYTLPVNFKLDDGKLDKKSVDTKNSPLIIIDGVTMEKKFKITDLKSENIEKIEVLKDASATAVYGEKGKDGVILITMKK